MHITAPKSVFPSHAHTCLGTRELSRASIVGLESSSLQVKPSISVYLVLNFPLGGQNSYAQTFQCILMLCQFNIKKKPRKARLPHILIFPYTCLSPAVLFHLVSVFAKTPDGLFNSFSFTPQLICSHSIHCQKTEIKSLNLVNIPNQSHQICSVDMISVPVNSVWMLGVEFLQNLFPNLSSLSFLPPTEYQ